VQALCVQYNFGAEKISTEWVAFASTHKGIGMTVDTLEQLDREVNLIKITFVLDLFYFYIWQSTSNCIL